MMTDPHPTTALRRLLDNAGTPVPNTPFVTLMIRLADLEEARAELDAIEARDEQEPAP